MLHLEFNFQSLEKANQHNQIKAQQNMNKGNILKTGIGYRFSYPG